MGQAGGLLGTCLNLPTTLREMVTLVIPEFADTCELFLAEEPCPAGTKPDPLVLRPTLWEHSADLPRPPAGLRLPPSGADVDLTGSQTGRAFLARRPIRIDRDERQLHSETRGLAALYRHFGIRSAIIAPLLAGRNCLGCAGFGVTAARPYDEPDVHTAMELGSRIAAAIANARTFDYQRAAALTLQRALLPKDIPEMPNLRPGLALSAGHVRRRGRRRLV
ncbi:GAF domain-containing protein [Parafrankia sp. FMc2]|uniref:GAF domain-containing protein n=1 Tax=Parafrankia sp. FMc2 TaxID=3233196 RepID=UPI0034D3F51B